jgi:hypothetical protein
MEGEWRFYAPGLICETKAGRQIRAVTVVVTVEAAALEMKYGTVTSTVGVGRRKLHQSHWFSFVDYLKNLCQRQVIQLQVSLKAIRKTLLWCTVLQLCCGIYISSLGLPSMKKLGCGLDTSTQWDSIWLLFYILLILVTPKTAQLILHSCDRASWHVTVHRDMWPCIVTCDRASWKISL